MCGIVSIIKGNGGMVAKSIETVFSELLYADALRGFDSTGVFFAGGKKNTDVEIYKRALEASDFLYLKKYVKILKRAWEYKVFVGHNRAATAGIRITDELAHPFEFENIVGVHNGSLYNHNKLTPATIAHSSDSEAIFYLINQCGPGEVDDVIKELDGSFALVWYDKRNGNTYAIRNDERPLSYLPIENSNTIVLVSEEKMGEWILDRHYCTVGDTAGELVEGTLYEFNTDNPKDFTERKLELKEKIPDTHNYDDYWRSWNKTDRNNNYQQRQKKKDTSEIDSGIGNEIEMIVHKVESFSDGSYLFRGWCQDDPWPTVNIYIDKNNTAIKPTIVQRGDKMVGIITKVKEGSKLGFVITARFKNHTPMSKNNYTPPPKEETNNGMVVLVKGPGGKMVELNKWEELTKDGCGFCSKQFSFKEAGDIEWLQGDSHSSPICPKCADELENGSDGSVH